MSFFSWLRNRTSIRSPRGLAHHRPAAPRFWPRLEALEDRLVPSLVAFYPAEGNVNDVVGGHNGALVGGTFGPGFKGTDQAFLLDGRDDFVQVPNAPTWNFGAKDFTINLWANFNALRPDDIGHPQAVFVGHDEGPFNVDKWFFAYGGGYLNFHINSPQTGPIFLALAPFTPTLDQWYNLQVTRKHDTYTIYVNGTAVSSQSDSHPIPDANAPLTIGEAESPPGNFFMNGRLDEVAIYDNAVGPKTAAVQPASALSLAPLASSLLGTGQQPMPAMPAPGPGTPSAPPASPAPNPLTSATPAAVPSGAADLVFAGSGGAVTDDNAWLFGLLSGQPMDGI